MVKFAAFVIGLAAIAATLLSLLRAKAWWIRIWDFPRLQLAVLAALALAGWVFTGPSFTWPWLLFAAALVGVLVFQLILVWRYTPLAPKEVQDSRSSDMTRRISLVISNVLQTNRNSDLLLATIRAANPDVVLCVETDNWWESRLNALGTSHPYSIRRPLSNTYGMLLFSRFALTETKVDYLVQPDKPSMQAIVALPNGQPVWLNCVHPPPPVPGESDESTERDSALLQIARRVSEATGPVIVCGDLNDVAWSRSTRLFQKISRLVEPRKGRGLISTFHARYPGFRVPIDHVFHSKHFRLVQVRRLQYVGSDHFPIHIVLSYEPDAANEQEAPRPDAGDQQEARETVNAAEVSDSK